MVTSVSQSETSFEKSTFQVNMTEFENDARPSKRRQSFSISPCLVPVDCNLILQQEMILGKVPK
ncbi:hypothetical protein PanWU01x14_204020 [Parasponia andersonii]|uniref:Uncharacterized protein n=1 Tax=Parasponia andersonii TaxID=3476 RepID=A0A2P5BWP0_PARAD|nr:hypothetical protein PanWU01x14_204020 [Parasponia andersonii]